MKRGFLSRFGRTEPADDADRAPESRPAEPSVPHETVAEIVREIASLPLPAATRKEAISLRLDAEVLDWFRAQGPGYQTRINAILRAYKEAAG